MECRKTIPSVRGGPSCRLKELQEEKSGGDGYLSDIGINGIYLVDHRKHFSIDSRPHQLLAAFYHQIIKFRQVPTMVRPIEV